MNQKAPIREPVNHTAGYFGRAWVRWLDLVATNYASAIFDTLITTGGRIKNTTRVDTTYQILVTDNIVYGDTDSSAFTMTLPEGADGQSLKVINSGTGLNLLTIAPSGTDLLIGENSNFELSAGETLDLVYETDEGWE